MRILSYPEAQVPRHLREQQAALQDLAWPPEGGAGVRHDTLLTPVAVLLIGDDERVLACLGVLSKRIAHGGGEYAASGLSAVVTAPGERGRGYGTRLVAAARRIMAAGGADLGIFTCDPPLLGFYQGAGWQHLPGTVLVGGTPEHPLPSDRLGKATLGGFFTARARAAAGSFLGCRVEVYPGEIDRLW